MWNARTEQLSDRVLKVALDLDSSPVAYADVLQRWQDDAAFRSFFNGLLTAAPYDSFRWETPSLTTTTAQRPFEFVLLDSPGLAEQPDVLAFADYFADVPTKAVVVFPNLGKNAILVVPCPRGPLSAYGHLGAFVRHAPAVQLHALWQTVGAAMQRRLGTRPVWLSTAGAGVAWLHVRLDDAPKYYHHAPYR